MKPRLPPYILSFCCVSIHVARVSMTFWLFVYALPQNEKEFEAARIWLIESSPKYCFLKHESGFLPVLLHKEILRWTWDWWSSGGSLFSEEPGGISTAVGVPRPGFSDTTTDPQAFHAGQDVKSGPSQWHGDQGLWRNTLELGIKTPDHLRGQRQFLTFGKNHAQQELTLRLEHLLGHCLVVAGEEPFLGVSHCLLSLFEHLKKENEWDLKKLNHFTPIGLKETKSTRPSCLGIRWENYEEGSRRQLREITRVTWGTPLGLFLY